MIIIGRQSLSNMSVISKKKTSVNDVRQIRFDFWILDLDCFYIEISCRIQICAVIIEFITL